ncbi:Haptoglobin [Bienertia sinuspersici]
MLDESISSVEVSTMNSKKENAKTAKSQKQAVEEEYKECGKKNHPTEKCWNLIGYLKGHRMAKLSKFQRKGVSGDQKWNKRGSGKIIVAAASS